MLRKPHIRSWRALDITWRHTRALSHDAPRRPLCRAFSNIALILQCLLELLRHKIITISINLFLLVYLRYYTINYIHIPSYTRSMFEKARRNGCRGAPWLKSHVSRHVMCKARHDIMCGLRNTIFDLTYLFNVLFDSF